MSNPVSLLALVADPILAQSDGALWPPHPLIILAIGVVIVLGMIIALRINAFIALITAALVVSLLAPVEEGGALGEKISRVAEAFGSTAAGVGIVIALAAVIGKAMMDSGAADRVVRMFLGFLGEKRGATALMGSGFALSIPVFFDTVFYLLVPLARSMYRQTKRHYLKYVMAISAGGAITHTLVPPTPGPLIIANNLGVDVGTMILVGGLVAIPSAIVGLAYAGVLDRIAPVPMREYGEEAAELAGEKTEAEAEPEPEPQPEPVAPQRLPGLGVSLAPILLPVLLITANSITKVVAQQSLELADNGGQPLHGEALTQALTAAAIDGEPIAQFFQWTNLLGNANLALLLAAAVAVATLYFHRRPTRKQLASTVEGALMSGGLIILITAGGGAFGAMLQAAEIGPAIQNMFGGATAGSGVGMLLLAFGVASLIKIAQGSSTVAMITAAAMIAAMVEGMTLPFHPVYLATAIGSGSLVGSWMNDSGFWIYTKMGALTEVEALKSWTPLLALLGITGGATTLLLSQILPMAT